MYHLYYNTLFDFFKEILQKFNRKILKNYGLFKRLPQNCGKSWNFNTNSRNGTPQFETNSIARQGNIRYEKFGDRDGARLLGRSQRGGG
jgi:hypothetical protein